MVENNGEGKGSERDEELLRTPRFQHTAKLSDRLNLNESKFALLFPSFWSEK